MEQNELKKNVGIAVGGRSNNHGGSFFPRDDSFLTTSIHPKSNISPQKKSGTRERKESAEFSWKSAPTLFTRSRMHSSICTAETRRKTKMAEGDIVAGDDRPRAARW
jgi:hypothetical protein